jgi:hypothetical protein
MAGKPKVQIDEDGDGDIDVTVEIDTPPADTPEPVDHAEITKIVAGLDVFDTPPATRLTYSAVRERLRGLL